MILSLHFLCFNRLLFTGTVPKKHSASNTTSSQRQTRAAIRHDSIAHKKAYAGFPSRQSMVKSEAEVDINFLRAQFNDGDGANQANLPLQAVPNHRVGLRFGVQLRS